MSVYLFDPFMCDYDGPDAGMTLYEVTDTNITTDSRFFELSEDVEPEEVVSIASFAFRLKFGSRAYVERVEPFDWQAYQDAPEA